MKTEQEFTRAYVLNFYKKQLIKFEKIGIGNVTQNGVIVTQALIDTTNKRLQEIQPLTARMIRELYKQVQITNNQVIN